MQPPGSRTLRAVALGVVAFVAAYLIGFVVPTFQNPLALGVAFVLVATAAMLGLQPITDWVELHARVSMVLLAVMVVVVLPLVVFWLVQPTYVAPVLH